MHYGRPAEQRAAVPLPDHVPGVSYRVVRGHVAKSRHARRRHAAASSRHSQGLCVEGHPARAMPNDRSVPW